MAYVNNPQVYLFYGSMANKKKSHLVATAKKYEFYLYELTGIYEVNY